jgi:hypothetical protein
MANFFTKILQNTDKPKTKSSIMDLTDQEKSEIDDQASAGVASRDIASSLKIPVEIVYNYRRLRNAESKKQSDNPLKDTLASKLQEREVLKADYELQKLKTDLEMKQQELEMRKLEFQKDMREWKEELKGDNDESDELGIKDLIGLISGALQKGNNPSPAHTQSAGVVNADPPIVTPAPDQDKPPLDLTDEQIKAMIGEIDKKYLKIAKSMPDNLLFDQIADKFPTVSDETIERAIVIFRKEF